MKSYLDKEHKITLCLVTLLLLFMILSCRGSGEKSIYHSGQEALNSYTKFLNELRKKDCLSSQELCAYISRWTRRDLAVGKAIAIEVQNNEKLMHSIYHFLEIRDSIKQEFYRLILSEKRTYSDVLLLRQATTPITKDSLLTTRAKDADTFFRSLEKNDTYKGSAKQIVREYNAFLRRQLNDTIHSKADMLTFIREEDKYFRALLDHLSETDTMNLSEITINSARCCAMISQAQARGEITESDARIYITLHDNIRLIQNMKACIDDTRKGKVKTASQARAYMYMILSPYSQIDAIGLTMLNDEQKKMLFKAAEETEDVVNKLSLICDGDINKLMDIPSLLMKIIIVKI